MRISDWSSDVCSSDLERWQAESKKHYARLSLPSKAATFLKPLLARVTAGVDAVAAAARSGVLRVDDELHLSPLPAEDEDPEVTKLRAALDHRIGEVQLPDVILAVDAQEIGRPLCRERGCQYV